MSMETMITVTNGVTVTYCPECQMMTAGSGSPSSPGYTTVYTTTYMSLCPTGMVPATYTVTESCTDSMPTWTPGPSHIPNGFTVTTKQCTVCDTTPTAVTITEPCGCEATEGVPASNTAVATTPAGAAGTPAGQPVGQISDGQVQASTGAASPSSGSSGSSPGSGSSSPGSGSSGSSPGSGSPAAGSSPGSGSGSPAGSGSSAGTSPAPAAAAGGSGTSAPPYPTAATSTETCPGPQCRAAASSYPSGVSYGNTSGIEPSPGAGTSLSSFGLLSSLFMTVTVAALAFTL